MSLYQQISEPKPGSHSLAMNIQGIYQILSTLKLFWEKPSPHPSHRSLNFAQIRSLNLYIFCTKTLYSVQSFCTKTLPIYIFCNKNLLLSTFVPNFITITELENQLNLISEDYGLSLGTHHPPTHPTLVIIERKGF